MFRQLCLMAGARDVVASGRFIRRRPEGNGAAKNSMKNKPLLLDLDALQTSKVRLSRHKIDARAFKYVKTIVFDGWGSGCGRFWSIYTSKTWGKRSC